MAEITPDRIKQWIGMSPFVEFMALELVDLDPTTGEVAMKMPLRPEFERGGTAGQFHGGPIAALIDTAGDIAVAVIVKDGVPTINFRVDYLRPSIGEYLIARATPRRVGRTVGVVDIDVHDDQDRLTAVGRGCYAAKPG